MESPSDQPPLETEDLAQSNALQSSAAADRPPVQVVRNVTRRRVRTTELPSDRLKKLLPWLVAVAFFMEALDITILNTAVPTIAAAIGVAPLSLKAALTSYTLSLAIFIPVSGWVADRFGTRRVFATAIGIFTVGSLCCGLSTSLPLLILSRLLQGLGGAMMMPVGRIAIVRTYPKSEMLRAMSFVAIPGLLGPLLGPLCGGLIVSLSSWRLIFFINLPIGLLGLYAVARYLPDYVSENVPRLDWRGFFLFGIGIALLSYVLEVFGEHTLSTPWIVGMLVVSVVMLSWYTHHAQAASHPLLRLKLFGIRTFRSAVGGGFITRLGVGGMPFLLPLFYQVGLGYGPVQSGLMVMPQPLAAMSLKVFMPRILARFGYRKVLLWNTVAIGATIAAFALVEESTRVWVILPLAFALGFFSSLQYSSINTLVFADVPVDQTSGASSLSSAMQQLSISFGIAIASLLAVLFLQARHGQPAQVAAAVRRAFVALGVLTILSAAVFRQLRPGDGDSMREKRA